MNPGHGDRGSDGGQNLSLNLGFVFYLLCELRDSLILCVLIHCYMGFIIWNIRNLPYE